MSTYDHADLLRKQHQKWSEIIDITDKLLTSSQRGNWQEVDELSLQRETMLENFFNAGVAQEIVEIVQKGIEKIRESDTEIVRLVKKNRGDMADEIRKLNDRKKIVKDYISNSR